MATVTTRPDKSVPPPVVFDIAGLTADEMRYITGLVGAGNQRNADSEGLQIDTQKLYSTLSYALELARVW